MRYEVPEDVAMRNAFLWDVGWKFTAFQENQQPLKIKAMVSSETHVTIPR
jgi:hypothetical protein